MSAGGRFCNAIGDAAQAIAAIDVAAAADLASSADYCRPVMSDDYAFKIVNGRHPVIETMLDHNPSLCQMIAI